MDSDNDNLGCPSPSLFHPPPTHPPIYLSTALMHIHTTLSLSLFLSNQSRLGSLLKHALFVVYEQVNPNDAFGRQMMQNLEASAEE